MIPCTTIAILLSLFALSNAASRSLLDNRAHALLDNHNVFTYQPDNRPQSTRSIMVDSVFRYAAYSDGLVLMGEGDQLVRGMMLEPGGLLFRTDDDTLLTYECGALWLYPIRANEPRTRILPVHKDGQHIQGIDHGFAIRNADAVYIHRAYSAVPTDSFRIPEDDTYWSVSYDGLRVASWKWGPDSATVYWSHAESSSVPTQLNGNHRVAVLTDSVVAAWSQILMISYDRGQSWRRYVTADIDSTLPTDPSGPTYLQFRTVEVRGTDIYISFVPSPSRVVVHYISTDLGRSWKRYTPATIPRTQATIPYRSGIDADKGAQAIRFATDGGRYRIIEARASITTQSGILAALTLDPTVVSTVDTLYDFAQSLDSCIAFDPGTETTVAWTWFSNGWLLAKPIGSSKYVERPLPVQPLQASWVYDASGAIIRGPQGTFITENGGETWSPAPALAELVAFTPEYKEGRLTAWLTNNSIEVRISTTIVDRGILVAQLPRVEAAQFVIARGGINSCVVTALSESNITSFYIPNFSTPALYEELSASSFLFADSLTATFGSGVWSPQPPTLVRVHEENGWLYAASTATTIGLRSYIITIGSIEHDRPASTIRSLHPNPASSYVVVQLQRDFNDATLCVFSTDGTRVLTMPIDGNQATIPVSALANGLYHVVVRPAIGSPSTSLLVIQR